MTELDIAKAIRAGELASPQQYENVTLFDVRVTGTGTSYRQALDEYVYRPPENFLTEEFVERCNGLPLIFEHPKSSILNTDEFRDRAIGTIILPYIKGDEVWGIAKVFDADAAELMVQSHVSTSPAVVFRDAGSTETIELEDGKTVLVEGKPSYLDHLAICEEGVWDKGGEPSGVNIGDPIMEDKHEVPAWADALHKRFDELHSRLDAIENKGGDEMPTEEMKLHEVFGDISEEGLNAEERHIGKEEELRKLEEEGRVDSSDEGEEEEMRFDAKHHARKDSKHGKDDKEDEGVEIEIEQREDSAHHRADAQRRENAELKAKIASMEARMSALARPVSAADRDALSAAQARADAVAQMFGDSVNPPLAGETPIAYRKRLAEKFKKHSTDMKGVRMDSLDGAAFELVENKIYADAQTAALNPADVPAGRLIPITRQDSAGRKITSFTGDMDAWLGHFKAPGAVVKFNRSARKEAF